MAKTNKYVLMQRAIDRSAYYEKDFYEIGEELEFQVHQFSEYHIRYTSNECPELKIDFWPGSNKYHIVSGSRHFEETRGVTQDLGETLSLLLDQFKKNAKKS